MAPFILVVTVAKIIIASNKKWGRIRPRLVSYLTLLLGTLLALNIIRIPGSFHSTFSNVSPTFPHDNFALIKMQQLTVPIDNARIDHLFPATACHGSDADGFLTVTKSCASGWRLDRYERTEIPTFRMDLSGRVDSSQPVSSKRHPFTRMERAVPWKWPLTNLAYGQPRGIMIRAAVCY